jgi:hypothetical protein
MTNHGPTDATPDPEDQLVVELLEGVRPQPAASFRGALARQLADDDPGWGPRPEHLWPQALTLISVGGLLLLIGALISVGGI